MELTKICFWLSLFLIVYPIIIYPSLVYLLGLIWPCPVKRHLYLPSVTVLIPAHNEAQNIGATIRNKLEQDYPNDRLEIIVISDGSADVLRLVVNLVLKTCGSFGARSAK